MKRRKSFNRWIALGLTLVTMVSLCACGGKATSSADAALAKQYVYSYQEIDFPDAGDDVSIRDVTKRGDKVYLIQMIYHWDEVTYEDNTETRLLSMNLDGSNVQSITLETPPTDKQSEGNGGGSMGGIAVPLARTEEVIVEEAVEEEVATEDIATEDVLVDDFLIDGDMALDEGYYSQTYEYTGYNNYVIGKDKLFAVKEHYFEDYADPNNFISQQNYAICAWDLEGKYLWEAPIEGLQTENSYSYISRLVASDDGSVTALITGDQTSKATVDTNGVLTGVKPLTNGSNILSNSGQITVKDDGTLMVTYYNEDWTAMYLTSYDLNTDTVGEPTKLPDSFMWSGYNCLTAGVTTDIAYSNSTGIFGYNLGDEAPTQIMSYINSDLDTSSMNQFIMLDEEHFIGFYNDTVDYTPRTAVFTKVNPEDIPDKDVIVIAGLYINWEMKTDIIEFNRNSQEYRIVLKEYESYNTMDDFNAGSNQLNNDIISGNMPDILIANQSLPLESYIAKGLIADVGKLIEKDEELSQNEYMENVFDAYSADGKLYYVVPSFVVQTVIGKKATFGDRQSWTMQEFMDFAASRPEGSQMFGETTREGFMYQLLRYCGNDFIDVSTGRCNFDSEEFKNLLEYAKTLPQQLTEEYYGEDYWMTYQSQYRDDRTLLMNLYMSSLTDMIYQINGYFGEEITYIGFPSNSGNGSIISEYDGMYALSARSKNQEGAWQFIRQYLTEEYQESIEWGFPVLKKSFMERAQRGTEKPFYLDENGEKVEYDQYFDINGESVVLEPLSQAQVDQAVAAINATTKRAFYNEAIQNIITEEAEAFFQDQKSVDEVVTIIQSRAQIYVDENR